MAIMAAFELFLAEEAAAATFAEAFGAEALGAEALGSTLGADALGTALTASELAGLGTAAGEGAAAAQGITQAEMASSAMAGGEGAGAAGINPAQVATQQSTAQQIANSGIQTIPDAISPAQRAYMDASSAGFNSGITPGTQPLPAYNNAFPNYGDISDAAMRAGTNPSIPSNVTDQMLSSGYTPPAPVAPQGASPGFFNPTQAPGQGPLQYQLSAPNTSQGIKFGSGLEGISAPTTPMTSVLQPPSALESGMNTAIKFAKDNPFSAASLAYTGANALGLFKPSGETFNDKEYDGPLSRYRLSDNFRAGSANPEDFQYTPRRYATGGGIMSNDPYTIPVGYDEGGQMPETQNYAKGGSLADSIESYQRLLSGKPMEAPAVSRDVGIYYDQDPDTRYQDPLTAAQIRQAKVNQRAYVSPPVAKRPTPMGQLQMASVKPRKQTDSGGGDVEAAQGGIMHSSLGGYAAGGNPRLLKGPGDGMSDNIPATINGRQPARLADGEFVIPADVVSHLGNGSTEAGAKQLHAMMNKVRKARTGNPKQGKNIRPQKYMPK